MAYTPTLWAKGDIVTSEKLNKIEQGIVGKVDKVDGKTLSTNDYTDQDKAKLDGLESQIDHLESLVGSPLVASTAAEMTDEDKVYVYTGSETGYQNGNWYYYNGITWTSGGVYNSVAFETDDTLSIQGKAADAKKTGDELLDLKEGLSAMSTATASDVGKALKAKTITDGKVTEWEFGEAGGADPEEIERAVTDWLDEHPEATTTVQDGSITTAKLADWVLPFVFPEQFGAKGDGVTDDAQAIQSAINYCIQTGKWLVFMPKVYGVIPYQQDKSVVLYNNIYYALLIKGSVYIDLNGATIQLLTNTLKEITVISIHDCSNVVLKNGTVIGDRDTYTVACDNAQLITVFDSKRVLIDRIVMKDSKGDCFGHSGVQINQPNVSRQFEDFYMGNVISNCIMSHSVRHGMTFSKGRGVYFYNCRIENVQPEDDLSWSGNAIDMEPYYGYGSIFDVHFVSCSFENNANGIYFQDCDSVQIIECYAQGVGFRAANKCLVSDTIITGGYSTNSSGVTITNSRIDRGVMVNNNIDVVSTYNFTPDNAISGCEINYNVTLDTRTNNNKMGKFIFTSNRVHLVDDNYAGAVISIIGKQADHTFSDIVFDGNTFIREYNAQISGSTILVGRNTGSITFKNNVMVCDVATLGHTSGFIEIKNAIHVNALNNIFQIKREKGYTYVCVMDRFIAIANITDPVIIKDNIVNAENIKIWTTNGTPYFIMNASGDAVTNVVMMNNYIYGIGNVVATSEYINMLVSTGNVINNEIEAQA